MESLPAKEAFFAGIPGETVAALDAIERRQSLQTGEVIAHQGGTAASLFLVLTGLMKVWRTAENGTPITLTLLGPGEPIGVLHAVREMPLTSTVSAHAPSELLFWPLETVQRIMRVDVQLFADIAEIVARHAVRMTERLEEVATVAVEQRVARALCRTSNLGEMIGGMRDLPLSRQDIADMAATTLPTTSRIMARWREEGLIGGYRGRVRLLDPEALRIIAALPPSQERLAISAWPS